MEALHLKRKNITIVLLDIEAMYPSIKFKAVKQAVNYFGRNLSDESKITVEKCLELVKFGMGHTLVQFRGKYFEYGGSEDPNERGLTIGGHESAWLADLVAAYALEKSEDLFEESKFDGMYRDDGFVVFEGIKETEELVAWLKNFQS